MQLSTNGPFGHEALPAAAREQNRRAIESRLDTNLRLAGAATATLVPWLTQLVAGLTRVTTGVIGGFRTVKEYVRPAFELVGEALGQLRMPGTRSAAARTTR